MPNWSNALSRSASRWIHQVSASLGATLVAALIVQSLPRAVPEAPLPAPELTSGGKFAARAAFAGAYDGLDTMPVPQVAAPSVEPPSVIPAALAPAPPTDLAGIESVPRQPATEGPAIRERAKSSRPARGPSRIEARRTGAPTDVPLATTGLRDGAPAEWTGTELADGGLLRQVASMTRQVWSSTSATTRDAWTATASVSSSLVSRLIP